MPIPDFKDVLADPVFSGASVEQQKEIHANYWKAFDAENPKIVEELKNTPEGTPLSSDAAYATNIRQTSGMILDTREQLKDASPVQTKALNYQ